eukprot:m.60551 g.60551  ORF g.60551 m.60551 type:complete len:51 (-) comp22852_c0_seq1:639-791(-)
MQEITARERVADVTNFKRDVDGIGELVDTERKLEITVEGVQSKHVDGCVV